MTPYHTLGKALLWLGPTLLTAGLLYGLWHPRPQLLSRNLLAISGLFFVLLLRLAYLHDQEYGTDTSTWLASVQALRDYPDKLWVLLNYTDSRPLTVLPLLALPVLGIRAGHASAAVLGLLLVLGSLFFLQKALRRFLGPVEALLFTWAACLFWASTSTFDFVAYNSEMPSLLLLALAIWAYVRYAYDPAYTSAWLLGGLGLLLGCLPYVKFQTIPMGLVIAGFCLVHILQKSTSRLAHAGLLVAGGLLPTVLVLGYYEAQGAGATFWNDYLWNYFYYSYTDDFSSLSTTARFSPARILRFGFTENPQAQAYWAGLAGIVGAGGVWAVWPRRKPLPVPLRLVLFAMLLAASCLYSVLQAGNDYPHYLIFLFLGLFWAGGVALSTLPARLRRGLLLGLTLLAWVQGSINLLDQQPLGTFPVEEAQRRLARTIQRYSRPGESLFVWGYAEGLYHLAQRPPAYYRINAFWLYVRRPGLQKHRMAQFYDQMRHRRPRLFIDAQTPTLSLGGQEAFRVWHYPDIYRYLQTHYRYLGQTQGAYFYERKE